LLPDEKVVAVNQCVTVILSNVGSVPALEVVEMACLFTYFEPTVLSAQELVVVKLHRTLFASDGNSSSIGDPHGPINFLCEYLNDSENPLSRIGAAKGIYFLAFPLVAPVSLETEDLFTDEKLVAVFENCGAPYSYVNPI